MSQYFADIWYVLKRDGIGLDCTEEAILGGPKGETISIWSAMEDKHGYILAHIACVFFSIAIQWHHCKKQLAGVPMQAQNYIRAIIALIACPALLFFLIYLVVSWLVGLGHLIF